MTSDDSDYFERRRSEELAKAEAASSPEVRHVHETMAQLYGIRLRASAQSTKTAA